MVRSPPMFFVHYPLKFSALALVSTLTVLLPFGDARTEARDPIPIVVTIPILKDLAEQIGGPYVRVTSLLSGYENEHTYSPKPSDLVAVRKARLLFEIGLGLEVWVSSLVKNAGGQTLRVVTTSHGVELIQDGTDTHEDAHTGRTAMDPEGNPHIWLDPVNVLIMLRHITDALIEIDPVHEAEFRANQAAYHERLRQLQKELSTRTQMLADRRFIAHHSAWPYLAKRFDLHIVGTIHIQASTEPSALHLQSLIGKIRKEQIKVIASEIQLSQRLPELLARETKARVVVLTTMPGGLPGTETYLDMLRYNVLQLADALEAP
ncbi:MAG: metal ABC transporter substrate-binding protein [Nitrospira sp.]|nr:metal ABC transporter substrate-binding protein [Nitrospira sp.]MDH4369316.1 metal ABC transporter substrate-binding protein [Nitrospira sp.]MDH5726004.1 metal ABC transporter substrate-binding protein [Nitrospira sp.]